MVISIQTLHAGQMADFHAIIELFPVYCVTAGFERPVGALPGGGFGKPFQPGDFFVGDAQFTAIGQFNAEPVARETHRSRSYGFRRLGVLGAGQFAAFSFKRVPPHFHPHIFQ
jgi:hypothetical protein